MLTRAEGDSFASKQREVKAVVRNTRPDTVKERNHIVPSSSLLSLNFSMRLYTMRGGLWCGGEGVDYVGS